MRPRARRVRQGWHDPKLVERFERNLENMDALIGDALRFARGASEGRQSVAVVPFVADVVESYDASIPLEIVGDQALELPLAPGALKRVLTNLISNAQQHGEGVRVKIDGAEVHVIDEGPGIPEEFQEQVFQPFFRLDSSRSTTTQSCTASWAVSASSISPGSTRNPRILTW